MRPYLVGICGGTGSGKTTAARRIAECLLPDTVSLIDADAYYRDLSHLPCAQRSAINFDHPAALDGDLLAAHLQQLQRGRPIRKPVYDFTRHVRSSETMTVEPRPIIITEGMLIFALESVRRLFDLRVFIDEEADIRLLRRIIRDVSLRGRSLASVAEQYLGSVRPMHSRFVEPCKAAADIVLQGCDTLADLIARLQQQLPPSNARR
jgi:uridine kinase